MISTIKQSDCQSIVWKEAILVSHETIQKSKPFLMFLWASDRNSTVCDIMVTYIHLLIFSI